jgi:hypothetical protein
MSFCIYCLTLVLTATASKCQADDFDLNGHCVSLLAPETDDFTYTAAVLSCRAKGAGYDLAKIENQYMNDAFSTLAGEGEWDLAWIGASCHQIADSNGDMVNAWVWNSDKSLVLDGYTNFDYDVDPNTCEANQCISMGGTGYFGKWLVNDCTGSLGNAICADDYSSDAPTPAPDTNVPLTCDNDWMLYDASAQDELNSVAPTKCYRMVNSVVEAGFVYTWDGAKKACESEGATLAKIEDVSTNRWLNSQRMGVGAYDIAWVGAHCVADDDGVGRYRWIKDNTLVAAGYTNFDGYEVPAIVNCSLSSCISVGGAGYSYSWMVGDCNDGLGDAFCEKIPNGGFDDNATPDKVISTGKKTNSASVAAGVVGGLALVGLVGAAVYRQKSQSSGLGTRFISTSASAYSDVGSETFTSMAPGAFNSVAAADGSASL